jgi:ankyrin repeat protein
MKPIFYAAAFVIALSHAASAMPLHDAVLAKDSQSALRLLSQGADVKQKDSLVRIPLLLAVEKGDVNMSLALLQAGADINVQAANKDTPWLLAGAAGRTEILMLMIPKKPDFSIRNCYGGNALIPVCERGHVETVKLLLTTEIDVDHINSLGWTCPLEAVILGDGGKAHQDIVKMVLDKGANPNLADKDGIKPLAHAKAKDQKEIAKLIKAAGGK